MNTPAADGRDGPGQEGPGIQCMPHTILQHICTYLPLDSLVCLLCTCKDWRTAAAQVMHSHVQAVCLLQGRAPSHQALPATESQRLHRLHLWGFHNDDVVIHEDAINWLDHVCNGWTVGASACFGTPQQGPRCLQTLLHHLRNLVLLDLRASFMWVDDACCTQLGKHAPCTLRHLVLQHCNKITAAGVQALCTGGALAQLQSLVLRSCGDVGDGSHLAQLHSLRYLDASWCISLTTRGVLALCHQLQAAYLKGCDALDNAICSALVNAHVVDMSFTKVTGEGLHALARGSPQLRKLGLGVHNNNIFNSAAYSQASLQEFMRQRPEVSVLLYHV